MADVLLVGVGGLAAWMIAGDWIAGVSVGLLAFVWYLLHRAEGPPILALALTFQWLQVSAGVLYHGATGRSLQALASDYRPMVLIGLGCVLALALGLRAGMALGGRVRATPRQQSLPIDTAKLIWAYGASLLLNGFVRSLAWEVAGLTQAIFALSTVRFALLFLILRRLVRPTPRWRMIAAILAAEMLLGFTEYFATFREALVMVLLAILEVFDRRNARHWVRLVTMAAVSVTIGVLWTGIKGEYRRGFAAEDFASSRQQRLEAVASLTSGWARLGWDDILGDVDGLLNRIWVVYYPALAVSRVPSVLPHTDGTILAGALRHVVTPRVLFPEKDALPSDSEMVRQYSGVWVAGQEEGTSIAFGYAAESYIDFGLPLMFLPVLVLGVFMGAAHRFWLKVIGNRELAVGLVTVVFWLSLYQFEKSWIKLLGQSGTLMICLGGAALIADRFLARARRPARGLMRPLGRSPVPGRTVPAPTAGARHKA